MITDIFPSFILHRRQLPISTLFPYTTLFRSRCADRQPVRRLITSPPMLFRVDEALQQPGRSEEHTSELQSRLHLVCRLLLEKKNAIKTMRLSTHDKDTARHGLSHVQQFAAAA